MDIIVVDCGYAVGVGGVGIDKAQRAAVGQVRCGSVFGDAAGGFDGQYGLVIHRINGDVHGF